MRKIGFVGLAAFIAFTGATGFLAVHAQAPASSAQIPNLAGIWDGSGRARPVNSETVPWGKDNFPVLNERALAYQKVFDEAIAPKYDCQPATPPAIQYDPYSMEVMQWPDRVVFRTRRTISCGPSGSTAVSRRCTTRASRDSRSATTRATR